MHKLFSLIQMAIFAGCLNPMITLAQQKKHVTLFGHLDPEPIHYAGSWGWTAPDGSEYALIGAWSGTFAINIDDSTNLQALDYVPGPGSNWREITVVGNHAFVVTEGTGTGEGMQVIDLSYLPDSLHLVTTFDSTFSTAHIISKNIEGDNFVYVSGTNTSQGVHFIDISDPANPVETGGFFPGRYVHDCHVRGDRLYAAEIYEGRMDIVNIADRLNPQLIGTITQFGALTHSSWTSADHQYLFVAYEQNGLPARIWDISDLSNIEEVARYSANGGSLVHNPYIRGDFAFVSHNTEGLRVVDIADPEVPVEVGFYDTWPGPSIGTFGLWSACPFFPSGKIIGANRHNGLYIFRFHERRAARIYGTVTNSISQQPIPQARVYLTGRKDTVYSDFEGKFSLGLLPDTLAYSLVATSAGYKTGMVNPLVIQDSDSMIIHMKLSPQSTPLEAELRQQGLLIVPSEEPGQLQVRLSMNPQPDLEIKVSTLTGEELYLVKDERIFHGLSAGMYIVSLWKAGKQIQATKAIVY